LQYDPSQASPPMTTRYQNRGSADSTCSCVSACFSTTK
jgi:hypothetical protein